MKAREEAEKRKMPLLVMFQDEARFGRINKKNVGYLQKSDPKLCRWGSKSTRWEI